MPGTRKTKGRWSQRRIREWYSNQPWFVGCNFIPSTAINQLEMWQDDTFDPKTIDRELGWAENLGFNAVRVFLHDLLWDADAQGFRKRIDRYLKIAETHAIRTMFVFFDECWCDDPALGKQPEPQPGVHNSGWNRSPGSKVVGAPEQWPRLERYVTEVLERYRDDSRIIVWDLYNEPGNSQMDERSLPLLQAAFNWARQVSPSQPLTAGIWFGNETLNRYQLSTSDIISFHNYNPVEDLRRQIDDLKKLGRPLLCTEYMRRPESQFQTHLHVLKRRNVGAFNWGLVSGKTQTIYPWGSKPGAPEPDPWFHDIFRPDGTPYREEEVNAIRRLTGAPRTQSGAWHTPPSQTLSLSKGEGSESR